MANLLLSDDEKRFLVDGVKASDLFFFELFKLFNLILDGNSR